MISIRFQRIIMFIPFVNALVLFLWLYNWFRMKWGNAAAVKSVVIMIVTIILPEIIRDMIATVLPVVNGEIWTFVINYLSLLAMGFGLICLQISILEKSEKS